MKHEQVDLRDLEKDAEKLRAMSGEVARISRALEQLSATSKVSDVDTKLTEPMSSPTSTIALNQVLAVVKARQLRTKYFPSALFADPAWDMLLELFRAELEQTRVTTSRLCHASAVPYTTALRWLNSLADNGMLVKRHDPIDKRRVFVELSPDTSEVMRRYVMAIVRDCQPG